MLSVAEASDGGFLVALGMTGAWSRRWFPRPRGKCPKDKGCTQMGTQR